MDEVWKGLCDPGQKENQAIAIYIINILKKI